jgi:hypothetical protein
MVAARRRGPEVAERGALAGVADVQQRHEGARDDCEDSDELHDGFLTVVTGGLGTPVVSMI